MPQIHEVIDLKAHYEYLELTHPKGCANLIERSVGIEAGERYIYWNDNSSVMVEIKHDKWTGGELRGFDLYDKDCDVNNLYYMHQFEYAIRIK